MTNTNRRSASRHKVKLEVSFKTCPTQDAKNGVENLPFIKIMYQAADRKGVVHSREDLTDESGEILRN